MKTVLVVGAVVAAIGVTLLIAYALRARGTPDRDEPVAGDVANHDVHVRELVREAATGARGWDIFSRLLKERIVFLGTPINDEVANVVIAQLLFLESEDPKAQIFLYINSPGGYVTAALAIRDTMSDVSPPVCTIVMGQAAGAALMLAAHGAPGARFALPGARLSFTRLTAPAPANGPDRARTNDHVVGFLAEDTGQPVTTVAEDVERERMFTPDEARSYGLIDEVYTRRR